MVNERLKLWIYALYESVFLWTLLLVLVFAKKMAVFRSKDFPLTNGYYFLAAIPVLLLLCVLNGRYGEQIEKISRKNIVLILGITLSLFFICQLYLCYNAYFYSGWDAGAVYKYAVEQWAGTPSDEARVYLSRYPNNVFLVWLYASVFRLVSLCPHVSMEFSLVIVQCVIDAVTMFLAFEVTFNITSNYRLSLFVLFWCILFIGFSPWFIVAYSDATGILFPVLLLWIYQLSMKTKDTVWERIVWAALGFVAMTGLHIKPQIIIVLVAILLAEVMHLKIGTSKDSLKKIWIRVFGLLCGVVLFMTPYRMLVVPSMHISFDSELSMGLPHYFMMGLNDEHDGIYYQEDYDFSVQIEDRKERQIADMQRAMDRIHSYGIRGMLRHLSRKQLVNYGDGTFAWAVEGNSFSGEPERINVKVSRFLHSCIYPDGEHYNAFISLKQILWVVLLVGNLGTVFYNTKCISKEGDCLILTMVLAILGLTVFELLFEARARYLFCYTPIYVILGGWGMRNIFKIGVSIGDLS